MSENRRFLLRERPLSLAILLPTWFTHEPGKSRKLERDHTMNVKRRVRDERFFLLLAITSVYYWSII
jgi:hypothetical protein